MEARNGNFRKLNGKIKSHFIIDEYFTQEEIDRLSESVGKYNLREHFQVPEYLAKPFTGGLREMIYGKQGHVINDAAQEVAQDVEFVEVLTTPDPSLPSALLRHQGGECCSGHECFFKRTGVRCITCKQLETE